MVLTFKHDSGEIEEYFLEDMTDTGLAEFRFQLRNRQNNIQSQLDDAKTERLLSGTYADPIWFRAAQKALRVTEMQLEAVDFEIRRRDREWTFYSKFYSIARDTLHPPMFAGLVEMAREESNAA